MKFRYLTFDCYGTLVDWRKGISSSLEYLGVGPEAVLKAYVAAEKEQEKTYQKYRVVLRKSAMEATGNLGRRIGYRAAAAFASSVPAWPAFPDTHSFLKRAGGAGYLRYILSNVDRDILEETIRRQGLEVDGYVSAEDVRSYKPGKAHWLRFLKSTGAAKEEVLHVAQSLFHDIFPTQGLGIRSAWVNRYREQIPPGARPLYITDNLSHLWGTLERAR